MVRAGLAPRQTRLALPEFTTLWLPPGASHQDCDVFIFTFQVINPLCSGRFLKKRDALDDPEHCDTTDRIRRDHSRPVR